MLLIGLTVDAVAAAISPDGGSLDEEPLNRTRERSLSHAEVQRYFHSARTAPNVGSAMLQKLKFRSYSKRYRFRNMGSDVHAARASILHNSMASCELLSAEMARMDNFRCG